MVLIGNPFPKKYINWIQLYFSDDKTTFQYFYSWIVYWYINVKSFSIWRPKVTNCQIFTINREIVWEYVSKNNKFFYLAKEKNVVQKNNRKCNKMTTVKYYYMIKTSKISHKFKKCAIKICFYYFIFKYGKL